MNDTEPSELHSILRQEIDDLAIHFVLEDPDAPHSFRQSIDRVRCYAEEVGWRQLAEVAGDLAREWEIAAPEPLAAESGILRLREALDQATSGAGTDAANIEADPVTTVLETVPTPPEPDPASEAGPAAVAAPVAIAQDPELLSDFILESQEHLASIESGLLSLEQDPSRTEPIHAVFRGFHTIKGLAGFLELPAIRDVAHEVETILDLARASALTLTADVIDVVLEGADYLKTEIQNLEAALHGAAPVPPADAQALVDRLQWLQYDTPDASTPPKAPVEVLPSAISDSPDVSSERVGPVASPLVGSPLVGSPEDTGVAEPPPAMIAESVPPVHASAGKTLPVPSVKAEDRSEAKTEGKRSRSADARSVKVDTSKLDFLVDMVGEMVIAQSMLRHDETLNSLGDVKAQRNLSQLARITGEVQKTAMSMRMVPVGYLFSRMARLVRDLTRSSGKQAELELSGEDTELDRTIVEDLADPLMHMVRNAADHGIESAAERVAAGKRPVAKIELKAYHQAGHIMVEVSDDGRGLDRDRILAKARQRGLIDGAAELSDSQVFNLIFEPGFSTAEKITDISGRGVGMDVVKKQLQKMRGRIDIQSRRGQGTTFFLRLPLTLAIIDGLIVRVGRERYVAPIFTVRETFRPTAEMVSTLQGKSEMVLVRGKLLPLVRLHERFATPPDTEVACDSVVIVVESGARNYCLLVDELIGKQEVVIKNLGETFKSISGVAGGAILGDGRVGLILDMDALFGVPVHA